jgi:DNA-binding HxlR family transcriptional regulator
MPESSYNQFCPVAMAAEILGSRWTLVLLRELVAGSTRFNELRRGVPRMSPALLSKRLKDLEAAGIVTRSRASGEPEVSEYRLPKRDETSSQSSMRSVHGARGGLSLKLRWRTWIPPFDVGHPAQHRPRADAAEPKHHSVHLHRSSSGAAELVAYRGADPGR